MASLLQKYTQTLKIIVGGILKGSNHFGNEQVGKNGSDGKREEKWCEL